MITLLEGKRLFSLRDRVVAKFDQPEWSEVGIITGFSEVINNHPRLRRSLSFGDDDYSECVLEVIMKIADTDEEAYARFEQYVADKFPEEGEYVSVGPSDRVITFSPSVFRVPDCNVEYDLVAVMMPFSAEFGQVHNGIRMACEMANLRCFRVDDIWEDSTIIQDIFNLIFRSRIVVVDFTGKNPNVMYETGIAHTLGKHVIPISQSQDDVPFDMKHHRFLKYLPNSEGIGVMVTKLAAKLRDI